MLMISSSMGMFYGIHGNTSYYGPALSFFGIFMMLITSFQDGFIGSSSSGNNSDGGST